MGHHQSSALGRFSTGTGAGVRIAWVIAIGSAASACSLVLEPAREQCVADADCAGVAGLEQGVCVASLCRPVPEPGWVCLDQAVASLQPVSPLQVRVLVPFTDLLTTQVVAGVNLRACQREDMLCETPIATATADEGGLAVVNLPGGFDGYFEWESANVAPAMYFVGVPLVRDTVFPIGVISPEAYEAVNEPFANIVVEGRSDVLLTVLDCNGTPAAGITVTVPEADSQMQVFYLGDGPFAPNLSVTGGAGLVRLFNMPPGNASITGWLPDGREIGTVNLFTRSSISALANLGPSPAP